MYNPIMSYLTRNRRPSNSFTISLGCPLFLLFLTFMILKLCHVIDWSWIWVTAPLWIPCALAIIVGVVAIVFLIVIVIAFAVGMLAWHMLKK